MHWIAGIESRRGPAADLDELVLHKLLMKGEVRWHPGLVQVAELAWRDREIHDVTQLLYSTDSADLADMDSTRVHLDKDGVAVLNTGPHAQVRMLFPPTSRSSGTSSRTASCSADGSPAPSRRA